MKQALVIISLLALIFTAGSAMAAPVTVDFSTLGTNSVDITTASNPAGYTLNGVTFRYDDFGSGVDTAQIDAAGGHGSTAGGLILDFDTPVTALNFDFSLLGAPGSVSDALDIAFKNAGNDAGSLQVSAAFTPRNVSNPALGGDALGKLGYTGAAFDQAFVYFSTDAARFDLTNASYDCATTQPVPEPSTIAFLATGLLGLGGLRFRGRRSAGLQA